MIKCFIALAFAGVALSSNAQSVGTGFYITREGHIATNYHVIEKAKSITIKDNNNNVYSAAIIATDVANDLAIIKVDNADKNNAYVKISRSDNVSKGQKVFTLGFPNVSLQGTEVKYTDGVISSLAGILDQPNSFQISVPVQPGNSGGPLIDEYGNAIGVIVAKLSAKAAIITSGSLPENINYAVKSNYLIELARSKRIALDNEVKKDKQNSSELISQIERSVVLIRTEGANSKQEATRKEETPKKINETKNIRIAILPPSTHKTNKGFFETESDSLRRWRSAALNFAHSNSIDLVIFEGGAYVKGSYELQPQEITNRTQISFDRYRNPKIYFIESKRAIEESDLPFATANHRFFQFAELIGADIILNTVVYSSSDANLTDQFLKYLKNNTLPDESVAQKKANIKIVNNSILFSTNRYKELARQYSQNVATQMYLKEANEKIKQLAIENKIDLIFQVEGTIPASLDITFELMNSIDGK